ncbi:MAG: hypothetical protein WAU48_04670 [Gammaproteobacteria bacterium]
MTFYLQADDSTDHSYAKVAPRLRPTYAAVFLGVALLLVNSGTLMAAQLISATKVVVIDTQSASLTRESDSELTAIGGTRAKAIGGTRAKAIGGTRAKAIGGTRAKAIGGTRAKAIGGTRAKAIGGTRAKAIGGTRLLAVGDTELQLASASRPADVAFSPDDSATFEFAPVSFMGDEYDWIAIGPLQNMMQGRASVLGYTMQFTDENGLQSLFNNQSMVVIGRRHSDGETVSLETNDTFVSGVTEVVTTAQVKAIDASTGLLTLTSGVTVDYTQLLSNPDQTSIHQGDFVFVQGHLY